MTLHERRSQALAKIAEYSAKHNSEVMRRYDTARAMPPPLWTDEHVSRLEELADYLHNGYIKIMPENLK